MNTHFLIQSLKGFGQLLPALVAGTSDEDARWKPPSQNWSILEIVCHLVDEERDDFRQRVRLTLENQNEPWPGINPELTAVDAKYNEQDFRAKIDEFVAERAKSIKWLKELASPDWTIVYDHPHLGPLSAGDLLVSWAAHDSLHMRQIAKRKFEMIRREAGQFSTDYAGGWDEQ